jgi:uncharacterized membrane protein YkoI
MTRNATRVAVFAVAALAVAGAGTGIALATGGGDDRDVPIAGTEQERAARAALAHSGGGRVTATEVGDEESYYEVEITLEDGSRVDVQLDRTFRVVGSERDRADDEGRAG